MSSYLKENIEELKEKIEEKSENLSDLKKIRIAFEFNNYLNANRWWILVGLIFIVYGFILTTITRYDGNPTNAIIIFLLTIIVFILIGKKNLKYNLKKLKEINKFTDKLLKEEKKK